MLKRLSLELGDCSATSYGRQAHRAEWTAGETGGPTFWRNAATAYPVQSIRAGIDL